MTCDIYPTLIAKLVAQEFSRFVKELRHKKLSYALLPQNCPKKAQNRSCQHTFLRSPAQRGLGGLTAKGKSCPIFPEMAADKAKTVRGVDGRHARHVPR